MSTLEHYGAGWVLVSSAASWCEAAVHMQERVGITVSPTNLRVAFGQQEGALVERDFGIGDRGASLVRPDGVIAWRSIEAHGATDALERAMKVVAQPSQGPDRLTSSDLRGEGAG